MERGGETGRINWETGVDMYILLLLLLLSRFSRVRPCATPQTAAHHAPPSLGFSRQEHWRACTHSCTIHKTDN